MCPAVANEFEELGAGETVLCALRNARNQDTASLQKQMTRVPDEQMHSGKMQVTVGAPDGGGAECTATPVVVLDSIAAERPGKNRSTLANPPAALIPRIITEFLRKDDALRKALKNYNYHQLVTVKQLNEKRNVVGIYQRGWDVVFDDQGRKISRVSYTKPASLRHIRVSEDNSRYFEQALFPTEIQQDYEFKYLSHVALDKVTTYVFSAGPTRIEPGKHYFEGTIWVEDQDLQVVKADGKCVPSLRTIQRGIVEETLFPRFVEYRQQVDGTHWFPTVDFSDDTLQFAFGHVHVQVLVEYSQYRPFGAESHVMSSMSNLILPRNGGEEQLPEPQDASLGLKQ
jgi:hypothetical protein